MTPNAPAPTIVAANRAACEDLAAVFGTRGQARRRREAYPIVTKNAIGEELHVGTEGMFTAAGLTAISHPTPRRVVMRIDFPGEEGR